MSTTNSMSQFLDDTNRLNDNGLQFMKAMYEAITTNKENATATIELTDGTKQSFVIPSNIFLKSEVERIRISLENLTGIGTTKSGAIVSVNDGDNAQLRQIFLSTFKKAVDKVLIDEVVLESNININQNPLIEKLLSPLTTLKLSLPTRFDKSKNIQVTKFFLEDLDGFTDGQSYASVKQYLATNNIPHTVTEGMLKTTPSATRYYGDFTVLLIENNDDDTFTCRLDKKTYNDTLNVVEDSRELEVGQRLVTYDGFGIFDVTAVVDNGIGVFVTVQNISGYTGLETGVSTLSIYDDTVVTKTVEIPVKGQDKFVMFISGHDDISDTIGAYSQSILVDTSELKVISNGIEYNFNTYFASNILSLGEYLESIVQDNTVPRSLASEVEKPTLNVDYFKVRQINKHITDTADAEKIKRFSSEKNRLSSDITKITNTISKVNNRINKGQYKSKDEKDKDINTYDTLVKQKDDKQSAYNSTVENISSLSSFIDAPKASPKYRVQGFWDIDEPTSVITGDLQRIILYNVRYKFVPSNSEVSETPSINVGGNEGLISAWNETKTIPLKKSYSEDKQKYVWDVVNIGDADINNINQLEVPISYGESVIIQVQAVSEAGYPTNPQLSEWSTPIKVDFPEELAQDEQIKSIVSDNADDLARVAVNREFSQRNIPRHLQTQYVEQDRYFAHTAEEISSGTFTAEQKTISVSEVIRQMAVRIDYLSAIVERRTTTYSVEILAPDGRVYPVNKLSTINLFAGHYADSVDVNNSANYGDIIEVVFYIRLINNNPTTSEITSISSGLLTADTENALYENVPYAINGSEDKNKQLNGQIAYLRNTDVSGSNALVYGNNEVSQTIVTPSDIEATTIEAEKTIVQFDGSTFSTLKMSASAKGTDYVVMTTSHPLYVAHLDRPSDSTILNALVEEFTRISEMNNASLETDAQQDYDSMDIMQYSDNDKYLVGGNSTGSKLFLRISDIQNMQVSTSDSSSSITLQNGQQNALLIPIVYQYRMTDGGGRINGDSSLSISASNISYRKKMGVDLVVGNELFKFDFTVSSKFRQTTLSVSNSSNNTIINSVDVQSDSTPNIL